MTLIESVHASLAEVRTHKLRTVLQTIGVVLGVASLVAVQGLTDAGRRQAKAFFAEVGGLNKILIVNRPLAQRVESARARASLGLTLDDAAALKREAPGLLFVDPIVESWQSIRGVGADAGREVAGVTPDYAVIYTLRPARGRFVTEDDLARAAPVVVLGDRAARTYFGAQDPLGRVLNIGGTGCVVVGVLQRKEFIVESGENALEWLNELTLIPLTTMYARFTGDAQHRVQYINVVVDAAERNVAAAQAIESILARRHGGVSDFRVFNRRERLRQAEERDRVFDVTFLVTGIVSLFVGGVVIMNIMLASFQERIREVGVRKALGARPVDIALQFLVESLLVTALGGAVGLCLGIAFARGITLLVDLPTVITPRMAVIGVGASVGVGLCFGLYPAIKAARLQPVESLRWE